MNNNATPSSSRSVLSPSTSSQTHRNRSPHTPPRRAVPLPQEPKSDEMQRSSWSSTESTPSPTARGRLANRQAAPLVDEPRRAAQGPQNSDDGVNRSSFQPRILDYGMPRPQTLAEAFGLPHHSQVLGDAFETPPRARQQPAAGPLAPVMLTRPQQQDRSLNFPYVSATPNTEMHYATASLLGSTTATNSSNMHPLRDTLATRVRSATHPQPTSNRLAQRFIPRMTTIEGIAEEFRSEAPYRSDATTSEPPYMEFVRITQERSGSSSSSMGSMI